MRNLEDVLMIYMLFFMLLFAFKPSFMINEKTKRFKTFGVGDGRSLFTMCSLNPMLAVLAYWMGA